MKLRLKATAQDWLIFAIFAAILLYMVAIAVLNINSLAIDSTWSGLNPVRAFGPDYIAATIVLYIAALVGLFMAVKSHFFENTKGFGISVGEKDSDGYSRWATEKEMTKELKQLYIKDKKYENAGVPLINDGKTMWIDDGESHNLIIGSTGSGKTQNIVHPLVKILGKKGESMIITDPKGEIYHESAGLLKERGYNIIVLNFRDPQKGNTWNPLALPYHLYKNGNVDKAMELLDDVAANILYEEGSKDPFWERISADYFVGLTLGLFEDAKVDEVNINSISLMASVGEERYGPRSNYIKEYFNMKDPASSAYTSASGTVFAPEDTKGSILSTFKQKIRIFASRENLSEMLATSNFNMADIGRRKTAVFMIIQDEKKTYHALATIFIKQCYESLIDVAQTCPGDKLPIRTNFILDEFANMPPLKDVTTMITAARSRLIRFTMIIQNFAQLDAIYNKENAQTIRSNCNNLLYLLTTELAALKEISELCGEKLVKVGKGDKEREETRPLITVGDLQKMKMNEVIIKRIRMNPFRTELTPNWRTDWGMKHRDAAPFIQRQKKPIKVFNLKNFVSEKLKSQAPKTTNPFAANPFGGANPFLPPSSPGTAPNQNQKPQMDIDAFIKNIDKKIAELEAEEKANQPKNQRPNNMNNMPNNFNQPMNNPNQNMNNYNNNPYYGPNNNNRPNPNNNYNTNDNYYRPNQQVNNNFNPNMNQNNNYNQQMPNYNNQNMNNYNNNPYYGPNQNNRPNPNNNYNANDNYYMPNPQVNMPANRPVDLDVEKLAKKELNDSVHNIINNANKVNQDDFMDDFFN